MNRLQKSFFLGNDVLKISQSLLGKYLFTIRDGQLAGGIISEVEAYRGISDRASHAYGGRRTPRNAMMYHEGGVAYVYVCYGMHAMLNFVTNAAEIPDAILIRGIIPTHGEELMLQRTGKSRMSNTLTNGPGKVCKALGINRVDNGLALDSSTLWLEDRGIQVPTEQILSTPRIGIDYAGEDAALPYRFVYELKTQD